MIKLLTLHKITNDYVTIPDIDFIRDLANDTIADINAQTGGIYAEVQLTPINNQIILPTSINKVLSLYLNDIKMKYEDIETFNLYKKSQKTITWYENPRYYLYALKSERIIELLGSISITESNYTFKAEALKNIPGFITHEIDLPDNYNDIILKGILSKVMLHPKFYNQAIANQYHQIYQTALSTIRS